MKTALTKAMRDGLAMVARGEIPPTATRVALVRRGLITVTTAEHEESFRPGRSWSTTRWTRTRWHVQSVALTEAGRAAS